MQSINHLGKKRLLILAALLVIFALILCALPLGQLLGYEFCAALALASSFVSVLVGIDAVAEPIQSVANLALRATLRSSALLLLPLLTSLLNAFRVRNCNLSAGLIWFLILPLFSAFFGAVTGVIARTLFRRSVAHAAGLFFVLASLGIAVWRLYAAPAIFIFDPFLGYFPGSLYDEAVAPPNALYWSRLYQVLVAFFAIALVELLRKKTWRPLLVVIASGAPALGLFVERGALGFAVSKAALERRLSGERKTEHFAIHFSPGGEVQKSIELYAGDVEFRHHQLTAAFGHAPTPTIHVYLFESAQQKQALMGAGHTFIAKPWRYEVYLQHEAFPHSVLKHELAHVFAGDFGDALLHLARRGLAINMGVVEGVAVAAEWQTDPLSPHQLVRVLDTAHLRPALAEVMSSRFLSLPATRAYATAGSFCRFLLDTYGSEKLGNLYRRGGGIDDFVPVYGRSFAALEKEWSHFLDSVEVAADEAQLVTEALRRPSVFHQVCAHELALRREEARRALGAGKSEHALQLWQSVCHDDNDDPRNLYELAIALSAAGRAAEARATIERVLHHPKAAITLLADAHALLGDLAFLEDKWSEAEASYRQASSLPVDAALSRLSTVKRIAAAEADPEARRQLRQFLLKRPPREAALEVYDLQKLVERAPKKGLYLYLLARQLVAGGEYVDGAALLSRSLSIGLPDRRFFREAQRLQGIAFFHRQQFESAERAFAAIEADDWTERCRFIGKLSPSVRSR